MNKELFLNTAPFDFFPESESKSGILLIHGFAGTPAELRYLGNAISQKGFGAHCPLTKGHGADAETLSKTGWKEWLGGVEEKLAQLKKDYTSGKLFIGGFSLGSLLAIRTFVRHKKDFAGLVLMSLPLKLHLFTELAICFYNILPFSPDIKIPVLFGPDIKDVEVKKIFPYSRWFSMKAVLSLRELAEEVLSEDIKMMEGMVLLLHGELDIAAPPINTKIFCRNAKTAKIKVKTFPRSGHMLPVDIERDNVADSIIEFMN